jgi:hypothetical protein
MTAECEIGHKHAQYARHKRLLIYKCDTRILLSICFVEVFVLSSRFSLSTILFILLLLSNSTVFKFHNLAVATSYCIRSDVPVSFL